MRLNLRDLLTKRMTPEPKTNRHTAPGTTREGRANLIASLQTDVRQLQQDIVNLNKGWEDGTDQGNREDATIRLRAIEHELNLKQAELSRLQGRI